MKATGIVRRMDDLGRVVIPKEIRRTMGCNPEEWEIAEELKAIAKKLKKVQKNP